MILEIVFFYIFQMAIGQHVELLKGWNFKCWRGWEEWETSLCHFFQNLSIHSRDIAIFWFFKWPLPPSFIFEITKFFGRQCPDDQDWWACQILAKSVNQLRRYEDFSVFQNGGGRHLGFSNLWNFIHRQCLEGPDPSSY